MKSTMTLATLTAALLGSLTLIAASNALAVDAVRITNTVANPVPVNGTVVVSGTANVNVTNTVPVTGTVGVSGTVNIGNVPTVKLDPSTPLTVSSQPKKWAASVHFSNPNQPAGTVASLSGVTSSAVIQLPQPAILESVQFECGGATGFHELNLDIPPIPTGVTVSAPTPSNPGIVLGGGLGAATVTLMNTYTSIHLLGDLSTVDFPVPYVRSKTPITVLTQPVLSNIQWVPSGAAGGADCTGVFNFRDSN